ncbi:hypothetical protein LY76DRAFT_22254 [Colletotrichum caudatum]|nr:hypothetical protein LY76DRAFT_22254 [Colletotrichum caudatum]
MCSFRFLMIYFPFAHGVRYVSTAFALDQRHPRPAEPVSVSVCTSQSLPNPHLCTESHARLITDCEGKGRGGEWSLAENRLRSTTPADITRRFHFAVPPLLATEPCCCVCLPGRSGCAG